MKYGKKPLKALLSQRFPVPKVDPSSFDDIDVEVLRLIPSEVARKYLVIPISRAGTRLTVAMADPKNVPAMDHIKFMTGFDVEPVLASEAAIREALERYYGTTTDSKQ